MGLMTSEKSSPNQSEFLNIGGYLLLEHGYDQKDRIIKLLEESFTNIKTFKDLNKLDRAILAELR